MLLQALDLNAIGLASEPKFVRALTRAVPLLTALTRLSLANNMYSSIDGIAESDSEGSQGDEDWVAATTSLAGESSNVDDGQARCESRQELAGDGQDRSESNPEADGVRPLPLSSLQRFLEPLSGWLPAYNMGKVGDVCDACTHAINLMESPREFCTFLPAQIFSSS